jgi:hypothetical protein
MKAFFIVVFLVLFCLEVSGTIKFRQPDPNYVDDGNHNTKWFLLHYHKTGHDLVNHVSDSFVEGNCVADVNRLRVGRNSLEPHLSKVQGADIVPLAGVDMDFNWTSTFFHPTHINRILHFVRNPFDMVVSGYLYHSQIPPPAPERWITRPGFCICDYNQDVFMNKYAPKLGELRGSGVNGTETVREMVRSAVSLCKSLNDKYNGSIYGDMLAAARLGTDPLEAVRLEALRSLLNNEGGDILRMGVNALYEDKKLSKRVFTSQFPIGDLQTFLSTSEEVFSFLMPPGEEELSPKPFWTCIPRSVAVKRIEKRAFVAEVPDVKSSSSVEGGGGGGAGSTTTHITAGLISNTTRQAYLQALREDVVIGPLLSLVEEALRV